LGIEVINSKGESINIKLDKDTRIIVSFFVKQYIDQNNKALSSMFFVPDSNEGAVRENGNLLGTTRLLK
jgi:hypothetical protein